jgi:hypothetical protein
VTVDRAEQGAGLDAAFYLSARAIRTAFQANDREEALRHGAELSRCEQELIVKLEALNAAISQKQN